MIIHRLFIMPHPDVSRIFTYFPELTDQQKTRFEALYPLYQEWNEKINVVSRKDIENIYIRHVLHSMAIAKMVSFQPDTHILDVGTGGGFPGIPLAILFPEARFHLVDSIGKKISVVQAVAEALALKNVTAEHARAEKVKGSYDFVVTRAVARLKTLLQWSRKHVKGESVHPLYNGLLALKGGDLREELKEARTKHALHSLTDYFEEPFFQEKYVVYVPL